MTFAAHPEEEPKERKPAPAAHLKGKERILMYSVHVITSFKYQSVIKNTIK